MVEKARHYVIVRLLAAVACAEAVADLTIECRRLRSSGTPTAGALAALRVRFEELQRKRAAYDLELPGLERLHAEYLAICNPDGKLNA